MVEDLLGTGLAHIDECVQGLVLAGHIFMAVHDVGSPE
jgi:hypothetical protein